MNLLGVCLFALVVSIGSVQCENSLAKYVRETKKAYFDSSTLEWINKVLEEQTAATSPEQVGQYLQELLVKVRKGKELPSTFEGDHYNLEASLKYLVRLYQREGPWYVFYTDNDVNDYINVVKGLFGTLDVLARPANQVPTNAVVLFRYLRYCGGLMIQAAARRLDDKDLYDLREKMGFEYMNTFEYLFASQDNYSDVSSRHLSELASSLDFVKGDFDAKKMRKLEVNLKKRLDWRRAEVLIEFIGERCDRFLQIFKDAINLINLYRMLNPIGTSYYALNKYSEYGRLCYQFSDPETSGQVRAHIRKQLATSVGKLVESVRGAASCGRNVMSEED